MQHRFVAARVDEKLEAQSVLRTPRTTHFFEAYWADQARGKLQQSVLWLFRLLFKRPPSHPPQLRPLWVSAWAVAIVAAIFAMLGVLDPLVAKGSTTLASIFVGAGTLFALHHFLGSYLADAALYLGGSPAGYKLREQALQGTVQLIKDLTENGEYDRIIVVGHSLGSVIAFEALRIVWEQHFWNVFGVATSRQPALDALESTAKAMYDNASPPDAKMFQERQLALWREMRVHGNPWRVTDLITLGSPIAHAKFLMKDKLPTIPPRPATDPREIPPYAIRLKDPDPARFKQLTVNFRALHARDGLFLMTRWTNVYFPTRWGLCGDIVGGALVPCLGPGVLDRAISVSNWLRSYTPLAHVSYFWRPKDGTPTPAVQALVDAMDLNAERLGIPRREKDTGSYEPY